MILAFDPSSTAIGWALLDSSGDPTRRSASGVLHCPANWPWSLRTRNLVGQAAELIRRHADEITVAVVEVPGLTHRGTKQGAGRATHRYALAVGCLVANLWHILPETTPVVTVEAESWTRLGGGRAQAKERRIGQLEAIDRRYVRANDPGGDEADAIMLGCWWATANGWRDPMEIDLEIPPVNVGAGRRLNLGNVVVSPVARPARAVGRSNSSSNGSGRSAKKKR